MAVSYSVETCRQLARTFADTGVVRPMRVGRHDPGAELTYHVTGVAPAAQAMVRLKVDRFVGGGFAGQVYRVEVLAIEGEQIAGLAVGGRYAMKILIPPSPVAVRFRNAIYWLGLQGPFSLQCNPAASRAGALWQKFIRRAAGIEFGSERAVVDILGTFVDERMGSCGELSEWLEGRNWRFEVDDNLSARRKWRVDQPIVQEGLGAPEYRAKKAFMARLVGLLHQLGMPEFARQYEWWTCKSQPNCLKRLDGPDDPEAGLTAVDFRAGLALLACLPMSPGDVKLILAGLFKRGSLVQFDRGNVAKLEAYVGRHPDRFADLGGALDELKQTDRQYRDSQIDVTHNHVRLLYSRRLWSTIFGAAVTSWRVRNLVDDTAADRLGRSKFLSCLFALLGMVVGLGATAKVAGVLTAVGVGLGALFGASGSAMARWGWLAGGLFVGGAVASAYAGFARAVCGRADLRRHYAAMLTSVSYFARALRAHMVERVAAWHRAGRLSPQRALKLARSPARFTAHRALSLLPAGLHRFVSDRAFAWQKLRYIVVRPVRLYFNAGARQQWMREMVDDGLAHGMLTEAEAETIGGQLREPFIQKYLKSLAVHVCTLPITQVVSVIVAGVYVLAHPELSWGQAAKHAATILVIFQVIPVSPGSMVRGLYAVGLVIKERNYRDYKLAVWLSFWKYIGYLAFPLQMAYHYPAIARFMAGRWATGAVHVLPVFGERGALAEHAVFDLFYNYPLTLRRRMLARAKHRQGRRPRHWHAPICAAAAWMLIAQLRPWLSVLAGDPFTPAHDTSLLIVAGIHAAVATGGLAGGASAGRRILLAGLSALMLALAHIAVVTLTRVTGTAAQALWPAMHPLLLPAFGATVLGLIVAALVEVTRREPPAWRKPG